MRREISLRHPSQDRTIVSQTWHVNSSSPPNVEFKLIHDSRSVSLLKNQRAIGVHITDNSSNRRNDVSKINLERYIRKIGQSDLSAPRTHMIETYGRPPTMAALQSLRARVPVRLSFRRISPDEYASPTAAVLPTKTAIRGRSGSHQVGDARDKFAA